jgi:hypothetical protein
VVPFCCEGGGGGVRALLQNPVQDNMLAGSRMNIGIKKIEKNCCPFQLLALTLREIRQLYCSSEAMN